MKKVYKRVILALAAALMLITDVPPMLEPILPPLFEQLVPEVHAILGVRRRTRRRTAVIMGGAASAEVAAANQQTAAAQQQSATSGSAVPIGTVVPALPGGCTSIVVSNTNYFNCAGVYYKAAFQGNNLVYAVVPKP